MSLQSTVLLSARRSSLSLRERLDNVAGASATGGASGRVESEALDRWRGIFNPYGAGIFQRRLQWDGLDEDRVRAALRTQPEIAEVPSWSVLLQEVCAAAAHEPCEGDSVLDAAAPIAFEDVLLPFVQVARRRLRNALPEIDRVLSPVAQTSLDRALLFELAGLADQALTTDFAVARSLHGTPQLFLGAPGRTVYTTFVQRLRESGLMPLVERYPVLMRLLAVRAELWLATSAEFVARVVHDGPAIAALFGGGDLGLVADMNVGRGDTHSGGRTVAGVRFASGLRVMYKPRPMQLDLAFNGLIDWLRAHGLRPDLRTARILDRGEYGWMEFVHHAPVASEAELSDYYERAGVLLGLGYMLRAGDLHADNVIASGAHPVVVDMETMLSPQVRTSKEGDASAYSPDVLKTLLLPFWVVGTNGEVLFRGGGLGLDHESIKTGEHVWRFVNTDAMRREALLQTVPRSANVPRFGDRVVPPTEHTEDIVRGFTRCHEFLEWHRDAITSPGGPLEAFRGTRVRVLLRDTRVYGATRRRSLHPRFLRDGVDRSLELEILRVSAMGSDAPVPHWRAFASEQRDLEELDFPLFWAHTDGTTLYDSRDNDVGTFSWLSAYDEVIERLTRFDADDRAHQASLIRHIYAYASGPSATVASPTAAPTGAPADAPDAIAEARAIAAALEALVVRDADGSANWVGADRQASRAGLNLRLLPQRLYDGRAGVALFLAACDAVASTGHAALAADALAPLRRMLRDAREREALADRLGLGAGLGMGGVIYSLAQIGRFTNDARWLDDAALASTTITLPRIDADAVLEVLGGAAGATLALLSLHELTGQRTLLDRAIACGERLLDTRVLEQTTGRRTWVLANGSFGTGFAHGAGGIGAALARLATVSGQDRFAAAAAEAFAFEDAVGDVPREAIAHLAAASAKATAESPWRQTWCNGPIGVALGRALYGGAVPAPAVSHACSHDIVAAPDHPCCGSLGPAELMLVAGRVDESRVLVDRVIARARERQSYQISRDVPEARMTPAFFQGLSGIGYQLLRISHPERIRSALAFE